MSHHSRVLWHSHFKEELDLFNNELTGTLPTEIGNLNELGQLLCTHCLNSLMDFAFCMIICISLLWMYDLKMESVNWPKYLTTCKSCNFLISKMSCIYQITNLPSSFILPISVGSVPVSSLYDRPRYPLKWESYKTCKWWDIDQLTLSIFKSYIHDKDIQIII